LKVDGKDASREAAWVGADVADRSVRAPLELLWQLETPRPFAHLLARIRERITARERKTAEKDR